MKHRDAYKRAIKEMRKVVIRAVRLNYIGLPRSGKTYFRRRLMKEIKNILEAYHKGQKEQPSTGVAESVGQILVLSKMSHAICAIVSKEWTALKDPEDESRMIIKLINNIITSKPASSGVPQSVPSDQQESTSASFSQSVVVDSESTSINSSVDESSAASASPTKANEDDIGDNFLSLVSQSIESGDKDLHELLEDMTLLINTDTGGQAEFLDLNSSLVDGPSLNLLFHKLTDDLDKVFETYYTDEDGKSTKKMNSTLTVEEVLFQALSSISYFSGCFHDDKKEAITPSKLSSNSQSKVMFIGTHQDKINSDEVFQDKDKLLQDKIQNTEFFEKDIVEYASPGQLMFSVNNLDGDENEMHHIRKKLGEVIERNFEKIDIPVAWLVLSLYIRSKKWRTLSLVECEELAGKLNMSREDLQHALWFFHHCIGVHLYYPEILGDTLICDTQVVFDSATNLIRHTFNDKVNERVRKEFKEKGQFSLKDFENACSDYIDDLIPSDKLVKLLEHLGFLTVIPSESQEGCIQDPTYFMPCVLKSARESELSIPCTSASDPAPLIIHFNCGYVPMGLFPAIITTLVSQEKQLGWILINKKGRRLWKNKVQFRIHFGTRYDRVFLLSHPRFFEIALLPKQHSSTDLELLCAHIRGDVINTLDGIMAKRLQSNFRCYDYPGNDHYQLYKFGFVNECPDHPGKDQLCVLEDDGYSEMLCVQCDNEVQLKPRHAVWFAGVGSSSGIHAYINTLVAVTGRKRTL